jgi:hypothetical protein
LVDHWNEKVTDMSPEDPKLSTPLEKLLHEHYEIGEQILDIQDDRIKHDLNADDDPTDEDAS